MTNSYSALNVTIRLFEQRLMTRDDFKQIWQMSSDEAIRQALSDHHYPVKEQDSWEEIFDARLKADYQEFYHSVPNTRILDFFALRFDYHNLKVLYKEHISNRDLSDLYLTYGHYDLKTLRQLINGEGEGDLPQPLAKAVREVKAAYNEQHDTNSISILFDLGYLEHIRHLAEEVEEPAIENWIKQWIDLKNLIMGLRMRHDQRSRGFMYVVLSDQGTLTEDEWVEVLQSDDNKRIAHLVERITDNKTIQKLLEQDPLDVTAIEHVVEVEHAQLMQDAQLQAFGPLPLMSYLYFLSKEIDNLRLVITGKQNDLDASAIEERMQPIYES
ncbi:MAG: V-type ATPase subunit [Aerococcus sp.]|nr:V-type ATPase subunit [Aerococcus sp.]